MSTTAQPIPGSVQRDLSKTARQPSPVGSQCNKELTHKEVAEYAYSLWLARGCPEGCGEEDWFLAEKRLRHEA